VILNLPTFNIPETWMRSRTMLRISGMTVLVVGDIFYKKKRPWALS
jgi:uncharacterized protein YjeT (DUF2065 family)